MRRLRSLSLLVLAACSGDLSLGDEKPTDDTLPAEETDVAVETEVPEDTEVPVDTEVVDTEIPIDPRYDDAELVIVEPKAGSIHFLEDGIPLQGYVRAQDGTTMPVTDLQWVVGPQTIVGTDDVFLGAANIYDVDVSVRLPNGDRLTTVIGGVRLQSRYTGVWAGSVQIDGTTTYQGQPIQANCIGPFDFEVGMAGRVMNGSGGCTLALVVIDPIDLTFDIQGDIRGSWVGGNLGFNVSFLQLPVGWTGRFDTVDQMSGDFGANLFVAQIHASLAAHKLSPYVVP